MLYIKEKTYENGKFEDEFTRIPEYPYECAEDLAYDLFKKDCGFAASINYNGSSSFARTVTQLSDTSYVVMMLNHADVTRIEIEIVDL